MSSLEDFKNGYPGLEWSRMKESDEKRTLAVVQESLEIFQRAHSSIHALKVAFARNAVEVERSLVLGDETRCNGAQTGKPPYRHQTEMRDRKVAVVMYKCDHSILSTRGKFCPVYTQYYSWRLFPFCYLLLSRIWYVVDHVYGRMTVFAS